MDDGAEAKFNGFVAQRHRALIRSAFVLTGDPGRAEDLVQDALYKTFLAWDRLAGSAAAESYVRTTLIRLALRGRKRRWTGEIAHDELPERSRSTGDQLDVAVDVRRALANLSVEQRAVLVLRYLDDFSEAETAAVLRCSLGTVKSRASRALAALRSSGLLVEEEVHGG